MTPILILIVGLACLAMITSFFSLVMIMTRSRSSSTSTISESPDAEESNESSGSWKTTGITYFGQSKQDDNGIGFTGVDLFKHGKAKLEFNGKPLFPAAVFQDDGGEYLYDILEVKSDDFTKKSSVYVHIVDVCNSGQDVCQRNTKKYGFLVDIHATAFSYVGKDDGLHRGSFRKVGTLKPNDIPKSVWHGEYIICSCKGTCKGGDVTWKKRGSC